MYTVCVNNTCIMMVCICYQGFTGKPGIAGAQGPVGMYVSSTILYKPVCTGIKFMISFFCSRDLVIYAVLALRVIREPLAFVDGQVTQERGLELSAVNILQ